MSYFSVIVPTMRVGGLDLLLDGLRRQTFKDFELVLVDGLHSWRAAELAETIEDIGGFGFPIRHVAPINNPFPVASFCRYANTGLVHANGRIAFFMVDYTWLPPDTLRRHAEIHMSVDPRLMLGVMAPHQYREAPAVAMPRYGQDETDRYAADLAAGRLDDFRLSSFVDSWGADPEALPIDPVYGGADPKLKLTQRSFLPASAFHAKNESVPLDAVLNIGGWDEGLDGGHPYQDTDLADRLEKAGMRWIGIPGPVAQIVNPRHWFPFAKRLKTPEDNKARWAARRLAGYPEPGTAWDVRHWRNKRILGEWDGLSLKGVV